MKEIQWLAVPAEHHLAAAAEFLALVAAPAVVEAILAALRAAANESFKARDILRAAELPELPADDPHVASNIARIRAGTPLSPVLLVRGNFARDVPLLVADGYHRLCASLHVDENNPIPARVAGIGLDAERP